MGENSIEARLLSRMRRHADADRIVRADKDAAGPLPLSFAQQRLWFLDRLTPESADYLVPTALRVRGLLDVTALETALSGLVARHEVLRTAFTAGDDGTPHQEVNAPWPVDVSVHDLRGEGDADAEERAREVLRSEAKRPFDLTTGRPLRTDVVRLADDDHYLLLTAHHIVSDGWSSGILARELRELYAAALAGGAKRRSRTFRCSMRTSPSGSATSSRGRRWSGSSGTGASASPVPHRWSCPRTVSARRTRVAPATWSPSR